MEGYWMLWCIVIVAILYFSGYKQTLMTYVSLNEASIYATMFLFILLYEYPLYVTKVGNIELFTGVVFVCVPVIFVFFRDTVKECSMYMLCTLLLSLVYSLIYTLYLIYRGYEPSMFEWLIYAVILSVLSQMVLKKNQLFSAIVIAKLVGDYLLSLLQQGQYVAYIGNFSWWEFNVFVTVSVICLVEGTKLFVNGIKFIHDNRMKS